MRAIRTTTISILVVGLLAGSAVGVAAQDEPGDPMAAALVTGTVAGGGGSEGTISYLDGFISFEGYEFVDRWETSDPRLDGIFSITSNEHLFGAAGFSVQTGTVVLENDNGRWVGTTTALASDDLSTDTMVLHGEDAYEGLTAYVLADVSSSPITFNAAIFTGGMPAFPELPVE